MHSFHHMRGRILLEALSALVLALSLAAAWLQTGALAFLPAGGAMLLFAVVHLSFLAVPRTGEAPLPQRIDFEESAAPAADEQPAGAEELPAAAEELPAVAITEAPPAKKPRAGRKSAKNGGKVAKAALPVQKLPPETAVASPEPVEPLLSIVPELPEAARIEPLFDPEPHFRQHRTIFGRKSG